MLQENIGTPLKLKFLCIYILILLDRRKTEKEEERKEVSEVFTRVSSKAQLVLSLLAHYCKHAVLGVSSFACSVFQIYSKPVLRCLRQAVYLVQSQPKLAIQVTEAIFVVGPASIEINGTVLSLLEHCPPPTGCCLVTEHIKGT